MGASSVTGVGLGGAENQKGPGNGRNQYVPLITPHVVAAGSTALVGGSYTHTFPEVLAETKANYAVVVTSRAAAVAYCSTKTDTDSKFSSFVVTGTGTNEFDWIVVKTGIPNV